MADLTIADVRAKYPQYKDLPDDKLVEGLHKKYYADMPLEDFQKKVGYKAAATPSPGQSAADLSKQYQNQSVAGMVGDIASGAASNAVDIARGAVAGTIAAPGEMSKGLQAGANWVNGKMGGDPKFWSGKTVLPEFKPVVNAVPRLGTAPTPQSPGFEEMGSAVAPVPGKGLIKGARAVPEVIGGVKAAVKGAAAPVIDTLRGVPAKAARAEAMAASKGALAEKSSQLGMEATTKTQQALQGESVATAIERNLQQIAERGDRPTLDVQGENIRTAVSGAYEAADKTRKAETAGLYDAARKAAAEREKDGARIDVSGVTEGAEKELEKSENIPELRANIQKQINAIKGIEEKTPVVAPLGKGKVASRLTPPKVPSAPKAGLTYEELDQANKYLKDIAYSGELQGYDGISRKVALDLSHKLDAKIAEFVPEHAAAAEKYKELSKPLESLSTRIGKAVTGGEGGIKGDAYAKVASQNLPQRLFGTKDAIDLVVDAIAGGKDAPPAARAAAQAQVDKMVEHWIMESARGAKGATGEASANALKTPKMEATLRAVPKVEEKLRPQFDAETRMARQGERAAKTAKTADAEAKAAAGAKARIDNAMKQAEVDFAAGSQKAAYDGYVAALRQSMADLDPAKYKAAIALIERAGTLQAKTDKARSLAKRFITGAALVGAGYEAKGLMP